MTENVIEADVQSDFKTSSDPDYPALVVAKSFDDVMTVIEDTLVNTTLAETNDKDGRKFYAALLAKMGLDEHGVAKENAANAVFTINEMLNLFSAVADKSGESSFLYDAAVDKANDIIVTTEGSSPRVKPQDERLSDVMELIP